MSMTESFRKTVRWIKTNPIYSLVGIAASIFGFVAGAPPAWLAISEALDLPSCLTYSDVYYYSGGHFRKQQNEQWVEYQPQVRLAFDELARARDYITLINRTPREDPRWALMLVRLPACGGTAQWTYENPQYWIDLFPVFRNISVGEMEKHAKWEENNVQP